MPKVATPTPRNHVFLRPQRSAMRPAAGVTTAVQADEEDRRFYVSPMANYTIGDNNRNTDNGAGGSIAGAAVAGAAPDGYTLMLANGSSHGVTPGLYPRLPYDSVADFAPVALISTAANVLVALITTYGLRVVGAIIILCVGWMTSHRKLALSLYVVLLGLTALGFHAIPTGFIPAQDKGYLITAIQLPDGASLARTDAVVRAPVMPASCRLRQSSSALGAVV